MANKKTEPKEVISYAQNWEDLILHVLLYKVKKGFYVDVGANGPFSDSVTQYFYERGWHGINIEPSPTHVKSLNEHRPRDINLQLAVGDKEGKGEFREYLGDQHGLSTLSDVIKEEMPQNLKHHDYTVEILPLKEVFNKHLKPDRPIDFLKIDVEGLEYEVIEGNDWDKYRPRIVVVESTHVKHDWRPLLKKANYKKVYFDGINEYYASREYLPDVDIGVYPKVVTERGPVISWQQYLRRTHLVRKAVEPVEKNLLKAEKSLNKEKRIAQYRKDRLDWIYAHPVRFALGRLYHYYVKQDQKKESIE